MSETTRRTTKRTPGGADETPATNRRRSMPTAEPGNGSRAKSAPRAIAVDVTTGGQPVLDREERIRMTAYFLAEQDGFRGEPESYWLAAERAVADSTTR